MSLPLMVMFGTGGGGGAWYYQSALFMIGSYQDFMWPHLSVLVAVLVVCAPGILFSYWLDGQHREKSMRKHLLAAVVFTPMVAYMAASFIQGLPTDSYFYPSSVELATIWVLVVLVFLPVFTREGAFLQAARLSRRSVLDGNAQSNALRRAPGRGRVIGFSIGVFVLFFPFMAYNPGGGFGSSSIYLMSTSWMGTLSIGSRIGATSFDFWLTSIPISMSAMYSPFFLIWPFFYVFNFLFGHSVLLYLQSRTSKTRVLLYGTLGAVMPLVVYILPFLFSPGAITSMGQSVIPLPFLQILGLFILFREDPVRQDEHIWDERDDRMWFDDDSKEMAPRIKVPILYVLKSRINVLLNRSEHRVRAINPHKADWAREEEVW